MPEILKHPNGGTNWVAIFSALAASFVIVIQQWQTYKISEIKAQGEVNKVNFLKKEEVYKLANDLENRIEKLELKIITLEKQHDK